MQIPLRDEGKFFELAAYHFYRELEVVLILFFVCHDFLGNAPQRRPSSSLRVTVRLSEVEALCREFLVSVSFSVLFWL